MKFFQYHAGMHWAELLLRAYVRPVVPDTLLRGLAKIRPSKAKKEKRPWLTPAARGYNDERCPADPAFYKPAHLDHIPQLVYHHTRRPYDLVRLSALDAVAAYAGVELRHPFLDRRLVEFLLHIPQHLRSWQGADRVILRKSMAGRMPDAVRRRGKTIHFDELRVRGLTKEKERIQMLLEQSSLEQMGLISSRMLYQKMLDFWSGKTVPYWHFFEPLYLEAWLQGRSSKGSLSTNYLITKFI
jgi:asparagine synthase (glutamine-hydrolysing)